MLDLTNLETIKQILKENHLWPKHRFGQNFLIAKHPLDQMIKSANIRDDEVVVEIGPGLGVLTQELAKHAGLVLAIESDYKMVQWLRKYFKNQKNVKIIHADILKFKIEDLRFKNKKTNHKSKIINHKSTYKVVSNLPYNITSPVIRKFLESNQLSVTSDEVTSNKEEKFNTDKLPATSYPGLAPRSGAGQLKAMILMVQKEVAERLTANPGSADRGILTVMVELFGGAEMMAVVGRENFYPAPSVDSAIIRVKRKTKNEKLKTTTKNSKLDTKAFMRFVKIGFSQKRRQIHHPLAANLHLPSSEIKAILKSAGIEPTLRAEDLTLEQWVGLYSVFNIKN